MTVHVCVCVCWFYIYVCFLQPKSCKFFYTNNIFLTALKKQTQNFFHKLYTPKKQRIYKEHKLYKRLWQQRSACMGEVVK